MVARVPDEVVRVGVAVVVHASSHVGSWASLDVGVVRRPDQFLPKNPLLGSLGDLQWLRRGQAFELSSPITAISTTSPASTSMTTLLRSISRKPRRVVRCSRVHVLDESFHLRILQSTLVTSHDPHGDSEEDLPTLVSSGDGQGRASRSPMSNLLFRKESDMGDARGWGGVSSGQALLRDHLQCSGIEGGDWRVFGGAARAHGIDTFGGKCGNSTEGRGTPCFSGGTRMYFSGQI